uniref:CBS domain-containing protein n=1 Tax=Paramoeba aestuarina TaxID=180227 RepID=A0A7S4NRF7_9EUKA
MSADLKTEIKKVLEKVKVSALSAPPKIIEFTTESDLFASFSTLCDSHILSAPVYDTQAKEYVGFLDLRDLVSYVIHAEKAKNTKHVCLKDIIVNIPQVSDVQVTISYLARRHRFKPVPQAASLYDVAVSLCGGGAHRVPVIGADGRVINIISQSVIIKHIKQHLGELPSLNAITVKDSGVGTSPVIKTSSHASAVSAFDLLDTTGRFGMAVTGEGDAIVTQTCAHDLKLWLKNPSSDLLGQPIMKFLQVIRSQDIDIQVPVLSAQDKDTLSYVIQKLEATRQHRIYIVDGSYHPIRVVSLTDLLKACT